ncbi:ATP-dependent rRNA helicase RRP3 [Fasciola hepatica]|uniref:RNA helicase n=1 Tax=Fasciola hepatica TaxID=6192 RepID=A0A4E0RXG9_FASHE|nr:ATP-dependent rRNA helicase RRP3 [Fasciola hepatica]
MTDQLTFKMMGFAPEIQKACRQMQWETPTAIQALSIPPALAGRNLVALAETGSGKTGAYALPIIQKLLDSPHPFFALILAPTRELAAQVHAQFVALGKAIGLRAVLLVGGIPITQQADQMRIAPPHVLIATPGRLLDHLKKTKGFDEIKFTNLRFLVIDEADRMLGSDFDSVLERILCLLPTDRQTFMFSATMTEKVGKLQRASIRDPVRVSTRKSKFQAVANLRQYVQLVPQNELDTYLVHLLRVAFCPSLPAPGLDMLRLQHVTSESEHPESDAVRPTSVIVFTRTRVASSRLSLLLSQFIAQPVIALNGDMPQAQRLGALHKFKRTQGAVLVATDVASRGLDIPQVGLVVNYDVPLDAKTYMHRVGRTARAGRVGCAVTLLTQYSVVFFLKEIESHLISALGSEGQKIPALVPGEGDEDRALEAAVAALHEQVLEAAARSNQAMKAVRRRGRSSAQSPSDNTEAMNNTHQTLPSITSIPGLKRTAWASEAPAEKREQISEVLQAMRVDSQSAIETMEAAVAEPHRNVSRKRARYLRMKAKHGKEEKTGAGSNDRPSAADRWKGKNDERGRGHSRGRGSGRGRGRGGGRRRGRGRE